MSDHSDDPTGRAFALLSYLIGQAHWPGQVLAERLGVTTRTVRRDVERLRRLGYDIDASSGTDGGYRLRAGAVALPVLLDADEAVALVTAVLAAAGDRTTGMVDASARALTKLHRVLPAPVQGRADAVRRAAQTASFGKAPAVDPWRIALLSECCLDGAAVRFDYVARDGRPSERRVEPNALITVRGVWYLVAYDLDRDDWRVFRADRMVGDLERTGHGVTRRSVPGGDPLAFLGASLADVPYEHTADIDLATSREDALVALRWLNPRRVDALDASSCRIHLGARDRSELTRQLVAAMAAAPATTVVAPPAVRDHLAAVATNMLAALGT